MWLVSGKPSKAGAEVISRTSSPGVSCVCGAHVGNTNGRAELGKATGSSGACGKLEHRPGSRRGIGPLLGRGGPFLWET